MPNVKAWVDKSDSACPRLYIGSVLVREWLPLGGDRVRRLCERWADALAERINLELASEAIRQRARGEPEPRGERG